MKYRVVALATCLLAGCVGPSVDVTPLHPAPHAMSPRATAAVQVLTEPPADAVDVYRIEASGGSEETLLSSVKEKAASLGCDGVVITDRTAKRQEATDPGTGALNDHREVTAAHVYAMCVVMPPVRTGSR